MKKILFILTTAISLGYGQLYDTCKVCPSNSWYNDLEYAVDDRAYIDTVTNNVYGCKYIIINCQRLESDSIVIIYNTKVSVFVKGKEYIVPNIDESQFVWISDMQIQCKYPPYDIYSRIYRNSENVSFYFP
jgi:hypothetical protein